MCAARCAGVAIAWHIRVEVHKVSDPLRRQIGRAGDDRPAVTPADQHHVGQVLIVEEVDDVLDKGLEVNRGSGQMGPRPSPVRVGMKTSCPAARSSGATHRQHHPPTTAPCTSTKVAAAKESSPLNDSGARAMR